MKTFIKYNPKIKMNNILSELKNLNINNENELIPILKNLINNEDLNKFLNKFLNRGANINDLIKQFDPNFSIQTNLFNNIETEEIIVQKIPEEKMKNFRFKTYKKLKKLYPEIKMLNATKKIKKVDDLTDLLMKCFFNDKILLYLQPDLNKKVWKDITKNLFQKYFGFPYARWVVLYKDNYAHGSMNDFDTDFEAINKIIKLGFKLNKCCICLENKSGLNICQVCKNEVCIDFKNKIKKTNNNNFICPYCRAKEDGEKIGIIAKLKKNVSESDLPY